MNNKVLIAYATRAGSTAEVAQSIGQVFSSHNTAVEIRPVKEISSLEGYTSVVIGSAVRMASWLPEAVKFVEQNRQSLSQCPCAFFAVHLMNLDTDEISRQNRQAYLAPVRKMVVPQKEAFFAGVGDLNKVGLVEKLIGKMVKSPEGDFRSWPDIRAWAEELYQAGFGVNNG